MGILTHEYALVIYGVVAWQLQQQFTKPVTLRQRMNYIGRSMIWGGMLVVFDDEIADFLADNEIVDLWHDDGETIVWYFYIAIGFAIDIIRHKITKQ